MIRTTALVSDRFAARTLRLRLAREKKLGVQIYTIEQLAARLAGGFSQLVDLQTVRSQVERVLAVRTDGGLLVIRDLPGTAGAVAATLQRVWRANFDLAAHRSRHRRLNELHEIEQQVLADLPAGFFNHRQLANQGSSRLHHAPSILGPLTIHGLSDLDPCWRPLLLALADGLSITWLTIAEPPQWLEGTSVIVSRVARKEPRTRVLSCASERHEIVEALRWARQLISDGHARPEEIAVAATDTAPYEDVLLSLAQESGLPLAFAAGIPALATREGQAAAALADLLVNGLSQRRLRRLAALAGDSPLLRWLPAGWQRVLPSAAGLSQARHWEQLLASLVPSDWPDQQDHSAKLRALIELLGRGTAAAEEAGEQLLGAEELELWQSALSRAGPSGIDRALCELRVNDEQDPTTSIAFLKASSLAATPRAHVWLLGLTASGWPRTQGEDPILPEHVLPPEELGLTPLKASDTLAFEAILAGARHQVNLSAPRRDRQGRPVASSPLIHSQPPAVRLNYDRIPHHAFSDADRLLAKPAEFALSEQGRSGAACWHNWQGSSLTPHDGLVRKDHPVVAAALERLQSASSLTLLLRNPLGFIWRYGLGAREPDLAEDPLTLPTNDFGTLVHLVAEQALAELERTPGRYVGATSADIAKAIDLAIAQAAQAWLRTGGTPPALIWRRTLEDVQELAMTALAQQADRDAAQRSFAEVPFGGQPAKSERSLPWDSDCPVVIPGTSMRIGGYIDRLDLGQESARVIDYKTGRTTADTMVLDGGRELQRCLYACAATSLLAISKVEPCLHYLRSAELRPLEDYTHVLGELAAALRTTVEVVRSGACVPGADAGTDRDELRFALPANASGPYLRRKSDGCLEALGNAALIWEAP